MLKSIIYMPGAPGPAGDRAPADCVTCAYDLVRRYGGRVEPCASCPNGPGRWNGRAET